MGIQLVLNHSERLVWPPCRYQTHSAYRPDGARLVDCRKRRLLLGVSWTASVEKSTKRFVPAGETVRRGRVIAVERTLVRAVASPLKAPVKKLEEPAKTAGPLKALEPV